MLPDKVSDTLILSKTNEYGLACTLHRWFRRTTINDITHEIFEYEFIAKFNMHDPFKLTAIILREVLTTENQLEKDHIQKFWQNQLHRAIFHVKDLRFYLGKHAVSMEKWIYEKM